MAAIDLEELVAQCRGSSAQAYIREAVGCYQASAYRSAVVATWNAVLFDLVDKIKEMAASGEVAAIEMWEKFNQVQHDLEQAGEQAQTQLQAALKWERDLLIQAKERLQLVDLHQFADLRRIHEDRNRCAHPTFHRGAIPFQPTPEQVRAHLRHAVAHLLSQPPVQGKALIAAVALQVAGRMFPNDPDAATRQIERMLDRPTAAAVNGLTDKLLYGYLTIGDPLHRNQGAAVALQALVRLYRGTAEARLSSKINHVYLHLNEPSFAAFVELMALCNEAWSLLELNGRERVHTFIANFTETELLEIGPAIEGSVDLYFPLKERIERISNIQEVERLVKAGVRRPLVSKVSSIFSQVKSWADANHVYNALIQPLQSNFEIDDIEGILRSHRNNHNDLPHSSGFSRFLEFVRSSSVMPPGRLDQILCEECLNYLIPVNED